MASISVDFYAYHWPTSGLIRLSGVVTSMEATFEYGARTRRNLSNARCRSISW